MKKKAKDKTTRSSKSRSSQKSGQGLREKSGRTTDKQKKKSVAKPSIRKRQPTRSLKNRG